MGKRKETLCWECDNAVGKCSWIEDFEPIPNWDATPTKIDNNDGKILDSFLVHECPLFKPDRIFISVNRLARKLNMSIRDFKNTDIDFIEKEVNKLGYELECCCDEYGVKFYISKKEVKVGDE